MCVFLCLFQFAFNLLCAKLFIWIYVSCEIFSRYFARKFLHFQWKSVWLCCNWAIFFQPTLSLFAAVFLSSKSKDDNLHACSNAHAHADCYLVSLWPPTWIKLKIVERKKKPFLWKTVCRTHYSRDKLHFSTFKTINKQLIGNKNIFSI